MDQNNPIQFFVDLFGFLGYMLGHTPEFLGALATSLGPLVNSIS